MGGFFVLHQKKSIKDNQKLICLWWMFPLSLNFFFINNHLHIIYHKVLRHNSLNRCFLSLAILLLLVYFWDILLLCLHGCYLNCLSRIRDHLNALLLLHGDSHLVAVLKVLRIYLHKARAWVNKSDRTLAIWSVINVSEAEMIIQINGLEIEWIYLTSILKLSIKFLICKRYVCLHLYKLLFHTQSDFSCNCSN